MGLDGVEFIMAVEEAFQVAIPDEEAQLMATPRHMVEYLVSRLGVIEARDFCWEQRAFYRLRRAANRVLSEPRDAIRPDTRWIDILPRRGRRRTWALVQLAAGFPHWPRLSLWGNPRGRLGTVGATARYLAARSPSSLHREGEGWSRPGIEQVVGRLLREQMGIEEFGWDQDFVRDLGMD